MRAQCLSPIQGRPWKSSVWPRAWESPPLGAQSPTWATSTPSMWRAANGSMSRLTLISSLCASLLGGVMAWLGFTLPSALALVAFAYGLQSLGGTDAGWLHGLKVVAVAVVAQAVWGMAQNLTPDRSRVTLAVLAAVATLTWPTG